MAYFVTYQSALVPGFEAAGFEAGAGAEFDGAGFEGAVTATGSTCAATFDDAGIGCDMVAYQSASADLSAALRAPACGAGDGAALLAPLAAALLAPFAADCVGNGGGVPVRCAVASAPPIWKMSRCSDDTITAYGGCASQRSTTRPRGVSAKIAGTRFISLNWT